VRIDNPGVILETVKYAENESGDIIVRLYESTGGLKQTEIQFGFDIKEAYITNMIEENLENVNAENNEIAVALNAFEVKTIKIKVR
jgi:alpha-mannosidase